MVSEVLLETKGRPMYLGPWGIPGHDLFRTGDTASRVSIFNDRSRVGTGKVRVLVPVQGIGGNRVKGKIRHTTSLFGRSET